MKDSKKISLFINSATKALSYGALMGDVYEKVDLGNPKAALERGNLGISLLCEKLGFELKDVDDFYTLLGPGSNTGIRLGLTIPRTIYAFNPSIGIYGIPTMELMCKVKDCAALSDRNGNLFLAQKDEKGTVSFHRVDKTDISFIPKQEIAVEAEDSLAIEELEGYPLTKVNILDLMVQFKDEFKNFSSHEEDYLPEYILKI
jgi:tRNA A37 threonylcarbamoyladenosine modification protein TsaB